MNPLTDQPAEDLNSPGADQQPQPGVAPGGASIAEAKETLRKQVMIDQKLEAILETGDKITRKDVQSLVTDLVAKQAMGAQEAATILADLPKEPDQVREWLVKHARESSDAVDQLVQMLHGAEAPPQFDPGQMPEGMDEQKLAAMEALASHLESLPDQSGGGGGNPGEMQPQQQPQPAGAPPANALLH